MPISINQHRAAISQAIIAIFSDDSTPLEGGAMFFPNVTTPDKMVSIEVQRNRQLIAVDVSLYDRILNKFSISTEKIFNPPTYNEFFDFTQTDRYDVTFQSILAGGEPNVYDLTALIQSGVKYAMELKDKIARAKELQRWQALQTGIVTLISQTSIDFKRKAASLVQLTGGNTWDNFTTANPQGDLKSACQFIRDKGKTKGNIFNAILGSDALTNLLNNVGFQNQAKFFNQIERTSIGMPEFDEVTGFTLHGRLSAGDFQVYIWTYAGTYEDVSTGNQIPYVQANNVIVLGKDFKGVTAHAGIPSIMGDAVNGQIIVPLEGEYYTRDVIDQVRLAWEFYVTSRPLAIPVTIDRVVTITTT